MHGLAIWTAKQAQELKQEHIKQLETTYLMQYYMTQVGRIDL
jgi:hypothetical protein